MKVGNIINKSNKIFWILIFLLSSIWNISCNLFDTSPWIWEIEGNKVTKKQVENSYEGYLFWWALQFNTTPEQLKEKIKTVDDLEEGKEKEVLSQLKKERFLMGKGREAPILKKLILVNMQAEKSGFLEREDVRKKIDFMNQFFTYNLYMMDRVKPDEIEVTNAEAISHFEELRKNNPQYRSFPIVKGREAAKQQLFMQKVLGKQEKIFTNILEAYKIRQNPEIELAKILDSKEEETKKSEKEKDTEEVPSKEKQKTKK